MTGPVDYQCRIVCDDRIYTEWREISKERYHECLANPQVEGEPEGFLYAVRALYAAPVPAPDLPVFQESKYGYRDRHLYNRASGDFIPHDEPVFLFRARDIYAARAIGAYANMLQPGTSHRRAVEARAQQFAAFAPLHPDRMKEPDTLATSIHQNQ